MCFHLCCNQLEHCWEVRNSNEFVLFSGSKDEACALYSNLERFVSFKTIQDTINNIYPKYANDTRNWELVKEYAKQRDELEKEIDWQQLRELGLL